MNRPLWLPAALLAVYAAAAALPALGNGRAKITGRLTVANRSTFPVAVQLTDGYGTFRLGVLDPGKQLQTWEPLGQPVSLEADYWTPANVIIRRGPAYTQGTSYHWQVPAPTAP